MATEINVRTLQDEIDYQKMAALCGPLNVWFDPTSKPQIMKICTKLSSITENQSLFNNFTFSASTNPTEILRNMASCMPRILVVALCNLNEPNMSDWVHNSFPAMARKMPFANLKYINIASLSKEDSLYLEGFNPPGNPTILVFKMGHLIDKFAPQIAATSNTQSSSVAGKSVMDQLREHTEDERQKFLTSNTAPLNEMDLLNSKDKGRLEWEQREREKRIIEMRKEEEAKRKEKLRVKARIEQQRKARQNK